MYTLNEALNYLNISLICNAILLFCLLSPNIVILFHRNFFQWKKTEEEIKSENLDLDYPDLDNVDNFKFKSEKTRIKNALHYAEKINNRNYTEIWELMEIYLNKGKK